LPRFPGGGLGSAADLLVVNGNLDIASGALLNRGLPSRVLTFDRLWHELERIKPPAG